MCDDYYRLKISLTNECNYSCDYCFLHYSDKEKATLDKWKKYLTTIDDMLIKNKFKKVLICITGGEPTLVPYFTELLEFIVNKFKKYEMFVKITTNLSNVKKIENTLQIHNTDHIFQINTSWHSHNSKINFETFQERVIGLSHKYKNNTFILVFMMENSQKCVDEVSMVSDDIYPTNLSIEYQPIIGKEDYYTDGNEQLFEYNLQNRPSTIVKSSIIQPIGLLCNAISVSSYIKSNGDYFPCPNCDISNCKIGNLNDAETITKIEKYIKFGSYMCQYDRCVDYANHWTKTKISDYVGKKVV